MRRISSFAGIAAISVLIAACGGGSTTPTAPPTTVSPTTAPNPATTATIADGADASGNTIAASDPKPAFKRELPLDDVVSSALADLDGYWGKVMPEVYGTSWQPISGGFYPYTSHSAVPPCPGVRVYADIAENAFYCPAADLVAWDDEALMPGLQERYGDFTLAIVMAHEIGHAVQSRVEFAASKTVTREQQADCFAGGWVASVANGHSASFRVTLDDLDAAVAGFLVLRDRPGSSPLTPGAHGSAFDRIGSFQDGYEKGARACAAYTDENVAKRLVQIPYNSAIDESQGGNMSWDSVLPAVSGDLESFWSAVFAQYGRTWAPFDARTRADATLARKLYDDIGDFATATLIGRAYASTVQERLNEPGTALQQSVQADCLTGAWAASMFLQDRPDSRLKMSPGDLDKAVMALLVSGDSANAVKAGTATVGTPFQRVRALRSGFMEGLAECGKITA